MSTSPATPNPPRQIQSLSVTAAERAAARKRRKAANDRASKLRRKEARRASRTPQQAQAAALAEEMKGALARFPTLQCEINDFLYTLHQRVHQSPDRIRDGVMQALRTGCATVEEIVEDTQFSEQAVLSWLESALTLRVVRQERRGGLPEGTGGARGVLWFLTGERPVTDLVLP